MNDNEWDKYGRRAATKKCKDCMVHCGYEPRRSTTRSDRIGGFVRTAESGDGRTGFNGNGGFRFQVAGAWGSDPVNFERDVCLVSVFQR